MSADTALGTSELASAYLSITVVPSIYVAYTGSLLPVKLSFSCQGQKGTDGMENHLDPACQENKAITSSIVL